MCTAKLIAVQELEEKTIILLHDFHFFLTDSNPVLIRQFKDVLQRAKTKNKTLIMLGCGLCMLPTTSELQGDSSGGHVLGPNQGNDISRKTRRSIARTNFMAVVRE